MVYKGMLAMFAEALQTTFPGQRFAACQYTALLVHGLYDSTEYAHFDVSATMFEMAREQHPGFVGTIDGQRTLKFSDEIYFHEGTFADIVIVDGVPTYELEGLRVRAEHKGQSDRPGAFASSLLAKTIAQRQVELAKPPVEPYVKPTPQKTWGGVD